MSTLPDPDAIKMFIGQIPRTMEESELKEMLEEFGPVYQIGIIRDKASGQHRGCAFVTFYKRKDAIAAQTALHGMKTMPGVSHPIQMKPAEGQSTSLEDRKLFIGMIPKAFNESDIAELFSPYGTIEDCSVLRDSNGDSKGCAFLLFSTKVSAQNAIRSMHHSRVLESCRSPLVVKLADTQKDKDMRKIHSMQQQQMPCGFGGQSPGGFATGSNMFNSQVSSMFGQQNLPNNNTVNPFAALAALGSLGLNAQQLQQVVALAAVVAPVLQSGAGLGALGQQNTGDANNTTAMLQQLAGGSVNQSSPTALPSSVGGYGGSAVQQSMPTYSAYGAPSGSQQSASDVPSGNSDLLSKAYTGIQQYAASFPNAYSSLMSTGTTHSAAAAGSQLEGPEGANLFIYNLPEEFRDNDMLRVFLPFGSVLSAKVFIDKSTGQSKCFGFVSYENPSSAQTAIQAMNGFLIGSKRLKVQLKRPKSESKPY